MTKAALALPLARLCLRRLATAGAITAMAVLGPAGAFANPDEPSSRPPTSFEKVDTTFQSVDATVSGQWEFPARTPAPLVVLLPANSAVDRDGLPPGFGADPSSGIYAQFAKELLAAGFAVFRYDSPGTGRSSSGEYCTDRSTALEGYTRAIDHPKVDRKHVFLIGHSASTDTVVGIYPRYAAIDPPAGVVLLANIVGETDMVSVDAPTLIVVTDKTPDDVYQHGQFPMNARSRVKDRKLETSLVSIPGAHDTLLATVDKEPGDKRFSMDPRAVNATIEWMHGRLGLTQKS